MRRGAFVCGIPLYFIYISKFSVSFARMPVAPEHSQATEERLAEIAEILAIGLMRLRARKSSGNLPTGEDFSLGSLARQSGAVAEPDGESK